MKHYGRRQRVCITDWDGTIRDGCILYDWLLYLDKRSEKCSLAHADLLFYSQRYKEGEITCKELLRESHRIYAQCMTGYDVNKIATMTNAFVEKDSRSCMFEFVSELLDAVQRKNIDIIVVSEGPGVLLQSYRSILPLNQVYATEIEVNDNGMFTGNIIYKYSCTTDINNLINIMKEKYDITLAFGSDSTDVSLMQSAKHSFVKQNPSIGNKNYRRLGRNVRELNRDTIKFISDHT